MNLKLVWILYLELKYVYWIYWWWTNGKWYYKAYTFQNIALIGGIVKSGCYEANNVYVSDHNQSKRVSLKENYGVNSFEHHNEFIKKCNVAVVAVKVSISY